MAQNPAANIVIMGDFNEGKPVGSPDQSLAVLFQARPPMVDVTLNTEKIRTHQGGGAYLDAAFWSRTPSFGGLED